MEDSPSTPAMETTLLETPSSVVTSPEGKQASSEEARTDATKPSTPPSEAVLKLEVAVKALPSQEEQLKAGIEFLKASLTEGQRPRFKDFWDGRRVLMSIWREGGKELPPEQATLLQEMSQEARKLKAVVDEQATAALAELEASVHALEVDVQHMPEAIRALAAIEVMPASLMHRADSYQTTQKEAQILNQLAHRMTQLRKEVLSRELRVRHKNQLLTRLSTAGDRVYPRRKELVGQLSQWFVEDVTKYLKEAFPQDQIVGMLNQHREEIKQLQQVAKLLSLNAVAFNSTRQQLADGWNKVKSADQERKRARQEKQSSLAAATETVNQAIAALEAKAAQVLQGAASATELDALKDAALKALRTTPVGRDQVKVLKDRIFAAMRPITDKEDAVREEKKRAARGQEDAYRSRVAQMDQAIESEIARLAASDRNVIREAIQHLQTQLTEQSFLLEDMERFQRGIRTLALQAFEKDFEDAQEVTALEALASDVKKARQELRNSVDRMRKSRGGSALGVTKALEIESGLLLEKGRLDQINSLLYEIESKLYGLKQG